MKKGLWSQLDEKSVAGQLRREIDAGGDPLGQKETGRDAPRFKDLIDRYTEVHLPHLSALNASDQKSMLAKMVAPDWGNKLVTEITPYDVEKLLNKVAAGRARPTKAKPNNRARKLQGAKPTPVRANRTGEVLRKMFTYAVSWGWRDDNPASSFRRRIENPRERFLCHEEIHKLAEALDGAEDRRAADITLWQQHMRGALSLLPMASGPWIWRPADGEDGPTQMNLIEGMLP